MNASHLIALQTQKNSALSVVAAVFDGVNVLHLRIARDNPVWAYLQTDAANRLLILLELGDDLLNLLLLAGRVWNVSRSDVAEQSLGRSEQPVNALPSRLLNADFVCAFDVHDIDGRPWPGRQSSATREQNDP